MITFKNLSLARGNQTLLENVTISLPANKKIGLVGANGAGKSTLFSLLSGKLKEEQGSIEIPKRWVVQEVSQHMPSSNLSALDFVLEGHLGYVSCQQGLEQAQQQNDSAALAHWYSEFEKIGGNTLEAQAGQLLYGLGFNAENHRQAVNTFSGGWRVRLRLAQALLNPCDLLLLDEPTNHLDLSAMLWLEKWLKQCTMMVIVIAHDTAFLNEVVDSILHLEQRNLFYYTGNYDSFVNLRQQKIMLQQSQNTKILRQQQHLMKFINRFRAKASKATQAQSRIKAFNRLAAVVPILHDSPYHIEMPELEDCPNPLIRTQGMSVGYGDTTILSQVSLYIGPQERIAFLGANGAGKSTLIKTLTGAIPPLKGELLHAKNLKIGYFAQHQVDQLQLEESSLAHLQKIAGNSSEQKCRDFLGFYGFSSEKALLPVKFLSGGERARLTLALLIWQKPHCLLLDEPTNHLDIEMRQALSLALLNFEGAVILISHDRELLQTAINQFYLIHEGKVLPFDSDLQEYSEWLKKQQLLTRTLTSPVVKKDNGNDKRIKSLENKAQQLEKNLSKESAIIKTLEQELAQAYHERTVAKSQSILEKLNRQKEQARRYEEEWFAIEEELAVLRKQ